LDNNERETLDEDINLDEISKVIKILKSNKSPIKSRPPCTVMRLKYIRIWKKFQSLQRIRFLYLAKKVDKILKLTKPGANPHRIGDRLVWVVR
jgi:hypothetical protein